MLNANVSLLQFPRQPPRNAPPPDVQKALNQAPTSLALRSRRVSCRRAQARSDRRPRPPAAHGDGACQALPQRREKQDRAAATATTFPTSASAIQSRQLSMTDDNRRPDLVGGTSQALAGADQDGRGLPAPVYELATAAAHRHRSGRRTTLGPQLGPWVQVQGRTDDEHRRTRGSGNRSQR